MAVSFRFEVSRWQTRFSRIRLETAASTSNYGWDITLVGRRIVMLHCFVKKSERTPVRERQIAEARMKELKRANA